MDAKPFQQSVLWAWTFGITIVAVLELSLLPSGPNSPSTGWDKTNHLLAFSVLAYLGCRAFPQRLIIVLMGLLAYGGLIEILQSFTPYRVGDWNDVVADGLGLPLGWIAYRLHRLAGLHS